MGKLFLGFGLALASAVLAYVGTALQAFEAREVSTDDSLRPALLWTLVRRPLWVLGTAMNIAAFGVQLVALSLASLAIVQPTFALGLVVLVVIGVWKLGESVGRREYLGVGLIVAGLVGLGAVAPRHNHLPLTATTAFVLLPVFGLLVLCPAVMRLLGRNDGATSSLAAGLAYAWISFAGVLVGEAFSQRHWGWTAIWSVATVACAVVALITEMTALQHWPVTRSKPVVFVLQTMLPAIAAPFFASTVLGPARASAFSLSLVVVAVGSVAVGTSGALAKTAR